MDRISNLEHKYITEVLGSNFSSSKSSRMIERFENKFAEFLGVEYAIAFTNGTSTMHAALEALGVGVGDEVIVPPLTMSATTFAVLQANATPIFADIDKDTFQISITSVKERISSRTKAVIPVGLYGSSPDLEELVKICHPLNIHIIEDNAEALGASLNGKLLGTFGMASSFSLQSSKHLTAGEGGVLISNNLDFASRVRQIQSLGYAGVNAKQGKIRKEDIQSPNYDRHVSMGWNYRMPELCAAVGLGQVERADILISGRIKSAKAYSDVAQDFKAILKPQNLLPNSVSTYWTWAGELNIDVVPWEKFRSKYMDFGGDSFYGAWKLTYLEPFFATKNMLGREKFIDKRILDTYRVGLCPQAERVQPRIIQLKTNFWDNDKISVQAEALYKTLKYFDR